MAQRQPCAREGCDRLVGASAHRYCNPVCTHLAEEWDYVQRQPGLDTDAGTEVWVALAAVGDAWTEYMHARRGLRAYTRRQTP